MVLNDRDAEGWIPAREFETFREGMAEIRAVIGRLDAVLDRLEQQDQEDQKGRDG